MSPTASHREAIGGAISLKHCAWTLLAEAWSDGSFYLTCYPFLFSFRQIKVVTSNQCWVYDIHGVLPQRTLQFGANV